MCLAVHCLVSRSFPYVLPLADKDTAGCPEVLLAPGRFQLVRFQGTGRLVFFLSSSEYPSGENHALGDACRSSRQHSPVLFANIWIHQRYPPYPLCQQ